jgi:glutamine amidotransferase
MKIGIIDYSAGNTQSVIFALNRLGYNAELLSEPDRLNACDKIIFPGVGHARPAMERLREKNLDRFVLSCKKPLLGICLGMQLLCKYSEEGDTACVGVFDAGVKRFTDRKLKIPHVGWNEIYHYKGSLFKDLPLRTSVYFVHSYYVPQNQFEAAACEYGIEFAAALQKDNFFGVQFHPEKSGMAGEIILRNFLQL